MHAAEIEYVVNAIHFVATQGHKFLSSYRYNHMTGEWAHTTRLTRFPERKWLSHFSIDATTTEEAAVPESAAAALAAWGVTSVEELLQSARRGAEDELARCEAQMKKMRERGGGAVTAPVQPAAASSGGEESLQSFEHLRWFLTAEEALTMHKKDQGENVVTELTGSSSRKYITTSMFLFLICESILVLTGPIRPVDLSAAWSRTDAATAASVPLKVSAFAVKRDQKFLAHTGDELPPPRYMTLGAALPSAGVAPHIVAVQSKPKVKPVASQPAAPAEVSAPAVEAVTVTKMEVAEDDNFTCATGTCSMRQRADVPDSDGPTAVGECILSINFPPEIPLYPPNSLLFSSGCQRQDPERPRQDVPPH
jgi:hypothetical protein